MKTVTFSGHGSKSCIFLAFCSCAFRFSGKFCLIPIRSFRDLSSWGGEGTKYQTMIARRVQNYQRDRVSDVGARWIRKEHLLSCTAMRDGRASWVQPCQRQARRTRGKTELQSRSRYTARCHAAVDKNIIRCHWFHHLALLITPKSKKYTGFWPVARKRDGFCTIN